MRIALIALAAALLIPTGAQAATSAEVDGDVLRLRGQEGADNDLRLRRSVGLDYPWRLRDHSAGIEAGAKCQGAADPGALVSCRGPVRSVRISLGAGADELLLGPWQGVGFGVTALGGAGDDSLVGTPQDDRLDGGPGRDYLRGRGGRDKLIARQGADIVHAADGDADRISCGAESAIIADRADRIAGKGSCAQHATVRVAPRSCERLLTPSSYEASGDIELTGTRASETLVGRRGVRMENPLDDGDHISAGGGNDCIFGGSGANMLKGGPGADSIQGGRSGDVIYGGVGADWISDGLGGSGDMLFGMGGADTLIAHGGPDALVGEGGRDYLRGGAGGDSMFGGPGADRIYGQRGVDHIHGHGGDDLLAGGPGADLIYGGRGDDVIRSDDRRRDLVDCGPGHDTAYIDRRDRVKGCETVIRRAWSASHAHRP